MQDVAPLGIIEVGGQWERDVTIYDKLLCLENENDHTLANLFNSRFATRDKKFELLTNARRCHFTGNIEAPGKVVTISLNPAWGPGTKKEQDVVDFRAWYEHCRDRFIRYEDDRKVHRVFKNLLRVIAPVDQWAMENKREYLQQHLLNLDWCPYYSAAFPTVRLTDREGDLRNRIQKEWDGTLMRLIAHAEPRYIFVHGKSMASWVGERARLNEVATVRNSRGTECRLWSGSFADGTTPIFYLEHFINVVNSNEAIAAINRHLPRR